jgi:hypothetical protein
MNASKGSISSSSSSILELADFSFVSPFCSLFFEFVSKSSSSSSSSKDHFFPLDSPVSGCKTPLASSSARFLASSSSLCLRHFSTLSLLCLIFSSSAGSIKWAIEGLELDKLVKALS